MFNINCICNTSKFRLYWKTQQNRGSKPIQPQILALNICTPSIKKETKGKCIFPFCIFVILRNTIQRRQHFLRKMQFFSSQFSRKCATEDVPGISKIFGELVTATPAPPAWVLHPGSQQHGKCGRLQRCKAPEREERHVGMPSWAKASIIASSARCAMLFRFAHRQFRQSCAPLQPASVDVAQANMFYQALLLHLCQHGRLASIDPSAGP